MNPSNCNKRSSIHCVLNFTIMDCFTKRTFRWLLILSLLSTLFYSTNANSKSIISSSLPFLKEYMKMNYFSNMVNIFICHKKDQMAIVKCFKNQYQFIRILEMSEEFEFPYPPNRMIFIADLGCSSETIDWAESKELFSNPFRWLFLYDQNLKPDSEIREYFQNISILSDSDVTLAKMEENDTFSLKKIYKFRKHSEILEESIATWNIEGSFEFEPSSMKNRHRRRENFQRTVLRSCIVITHNDSLNHLEDKRDKHIDSIAKVNYVLVKHLADYVNADLNYTVEETWGYKNNQSKWSGMIGELTEGRADIGGTALFLTADRVRIIDYISMTTKTRSKFVFREPKLSYVTNVFVLPFDRDVWISTASLIVVTALILFIVMKWEWHQKTINKRKPYPELEDSLPDVAILSFGALCQQGASAIPFSAPGRIITICLFTSLMFLYTSYSANIVALLQSSSKSIQTLEDLLKSRLAIGVDDTVFNRFYFPNATEPIRRAIYENKVAPPGQTPRYFPILEGVKKMREGLFAFHMETGPGYKLVGELFEEGEKCGLQEIQYLQVPDPWLAIKKNSSFKESLKIGLFLSREVGLQIREIDAIYTKKPTCTSRGSTFISVGIVDCYPPAVVLAGGMIFSMCLFLLEQFTNYGNRKKRERDELFAIDIKHQNFNFGQKISRFLWGQTEKNSERKK